MKKVYILVYFHHRNNYASYWHSIVPSFQHAYLQTRRKRGSKRKRVRTLRRDGREQTESDESIVVPQDSLLAAVSPTGVILLRPIAVLKGRISYT